MNAPDPAQSGKAPAGRSFRRLRLVGWIFVAMGASAILLPVAATVAAEALVAWLLVIWGVAGLWFAWEMRPAPEWRYGAATFALTLALGLVFALFPRAGIETLTIVMVLAFLMEGVVSILLGLRTSARAANWGWLVVNGLCSLAVGVIVLIGWPGTAAWSLGLLMGLNFLTTGISLLMLSGAFRKSA